VGGTRCAGPRQGVTGFRNASLLLRWVPLAVMALLSVAGCDADRLLTPPPSTPNLAIVGATETWDRVISNTQVTGDIIVPTGKKWLIGANVRVSGNVRTDGGTIAMRPGSSLTFVGAKAEQYVTGGMRYDQSFSKDWGIWVGGTGVLDVRGTPKVGWNRTGRDPTWKPGDELWISPTAGGDFKPRRWYPGQAIPRADPRVPAAEVINVTRDIVIEGPGHIHISSRVPQRIEYVTLRRMGIFRAGGGVAGASTGRYAIHLHMMGNGARGTVIQGVALVGSEGRGFVPHASHGVLMRDNVSVNSFVEAFWWDEGEEHATHDLLVDRLAVSGVTVPRTLTGVHPRWDGILLAHGTGNEIRNSAVSGVRGGKLSNGFAWADGTSALLVWTFNSGNVAHNNEGNGTRTWNNSSSPHVIDNLVAYRNGASGIQNGAYSNSNRYTGALLIGNGLHHNSNSNANKVDGGPGRYVGLVVETTGAALTVGHRQLPAGTYQEFVDCTLSGSPKVFVQKGTPSLGEAFTRPWLARFIRCDVTPGDIVWEDLSAPGIEGSHVFLEHIDGRRWEITIKQGKVGVTVL